MLDFSAPYAEVHGYPVARYEQNGRLYSGSGHHIVVEENDSGDFTVFYKENPEQVAKPSVATGDLDSMHWKEVQALVEAFGGTWTNRNAGIAFLRGE